MKVNVFISMFMMLIMGVFRSLYHSVSFVTCSYDGVVVAKLPFEPLPMVRGFFHSSIRGTNYYDCSMVLCACNLSPPRWASTSSAT